MSPRPAARQARWHGHDSRRRHGSPCGGLVVITWVVALAALVVGGYLIFFALNLRRLQRGLDVERL